MRAGEKSEPPVMLNDAVVILEKAHLIEGHVKRAARRHQQHRNMQPSGAFRHLAFSVFFGHRPSLPSALSRFQTTWLSPSRLMRTSRWMLTFISRPNPSITVTIALPP